MALWALWRCHQGKTKTCINFSPKWTHVWLGFSSKLLSQISYEWAAGIRVLGPKMHLSMYSQWPSSSQCSLIWLLNTLLASKVDVETGQNQVLGCTKYHRTCKEIASQHIHWPFGLVCSFVGCSTRRCMVLTCSHVVGGRRLGRMAQSPFPELPFDLEVCGPYRATLNLAKHWRSM